MTDKPIENGGTDAAGNKSTLARTLDNSFIALLVVSGAATFMGLYELMSAGRTSISVPSMVYSAVVVFVLTMMMGFAAEVSVGTMRHRFGGWFRLLAALAYFILAIFSISLAFAFWWGHMAATNATQTEMDQEVARVESNLRETRGALSSATTQLDLAVQLSASRSREENSQGGTCSPTIIQSGYGPAAKTRSADAAMLGTVRDYTRTRLGQLDDEIAKTTTLIGNLRQQAAGGDEGKRVQSLTALSVALVSLADQTKGLAADPGLASFRSEMRATAVAYRKPRGHANGIDCIDTGMASAIEGAERSIAALRPVTPPAFGIYEGNKGTMEAIARFFRTTFWFFPNSGVGLTEIDEQLAYAIGWIIDLGLFVIVALRSTMAGSSPGRLLLERARQKVADRKDCHLAVELLATERAVSMNHALLMLATCPTIPFTDLLVDWKGKRHLVIPQVGPDEAAAAQARQMATILNALDRERASGVREQLRLSGKSLFGLINHDRSARQLLVSAGMSKWATGAHFRWFLVTDNGLQKLATWASAAQGMTAFEAKGSSCADAMGSAIKEKAEINSAMQTEEIQHRANLAKARLQVDRARRQAELRTILVEAPLPDESRPTADKPMMFNS